MVVSKSLHPPATPAESSAAAPQKHSLLTTQLAQIRRNLPDTSTSESSSQESSSDTDDVSSHAAGAASNDVRPRVTPPSRHTAYSAARFGEQSRSCVKARSCTKCRNHWDVCVCTDADASFNALPRNGAASHPDAAAGASTSSAAVAGVPQGEPITPFRTPFRAQRGMSLVKPNASKNRQKQLETLRRYEEKFKKQMKHEDGEVKVQGHVVEFVANKSRNKRPQHPMYVHTLDVSRVLTEGVVTWQPVKANSCINAPEETIFYSLVEGRAELIMFGGLQMDLNSMQRGGQATTQPQTVSNNVYFLRPATHLL